MSAHDAPRTDAACRSCEQTRDYANEKVIDLARALERESAAKDATIARLREALAGLPDDIDMIEHNPEEGASYFCCGQPVAFGFDKRTGSHIAGCWYVTARTALTQE